MAVSGYEFAPEIMRVLGLEGRPVRSITIDIQPDEIVTATVVLHVSEEEAENIAKELEKVDVPIIVKGL